MSSRRKDWRVRHGPNGCDCLDISQSSCAACKSIPDNKKD